MALSPVPVIAATSGDAGDAPSGAIPVAAYGFQAAPAPVDPIVQALIDAGFGTTGQVLSTNATADGFEWITPA